MRPITLIVPFYRNEGMLLEQQRVWRELPEDIKAHLHIIVVDDGSPKGFRAKPVVEPTGVAAFRLYRILTDVRWNWLACRNLGVREATTEWVLLTDIDHVVPAATWRALMEGDLDARAVYRFSRVDAPKLSPYKPHPNSWFMTRSMYDAIGGYDERLSGCYGTDGEFRDRVNHTADRVVMRTDVLVRYPREVIADASTTVFTRKGDEKNDADLVRRRILREREGAWRPKRNSFPWERQI